VIRLNLKIIYHRFTFEKNDKQIEAGSNGRCKRLLAANGLFHYLIPVTIHCNKQNKKSAQKVPHLKTSRLINEIFPQRITSNNGNTPYSHISAPLYLLLRASKFNEFNSQRINKVVANFQVRV